MQSKYPPPLSKFADSRIRRLGSSPPVRAVAGSLGAAICGQLALMISGVVVARMLGVNDRGRFALLTLVAVIVIQIGLCGFPLSLTYYVARGRSPHRALRRLAPAVALQSLALPGIAAATLLVLTRNASPAVREAALIVVPIVVAGVVQNYSFALLQGLHDFRAFNVLRVLPAAFNSLAVVIVYLGGVRTIVAAAAAWVMANVLVAVVCGLVALRRLRTVSADADIEFRELATFGLKGLLGSTSPVDTFRIDQALVGVLLTSRALGLYVVALAFTNLPRFVAQAVTSVAYPHIASRRDRRSRIRAMWVFACVGSLLSGAVVVVLELAVPSLVTALFGESFSPAVGVTRILLLSGLFAALRKTLADCTQGAGYPLFGSVAEVSSWFFLVPALVTLIPLFGLNGAALAMTLAYGASLALLLVQALNVTRSSGAVPLAPLLLISLKSAAVALASATAGVVIALTHPSWNAVLLVGIGLTLVGALVARRVHARLDIFEPLSLFVIAWALMFIARPAVMAVYGDFTLLSYDTRRGFTKMLLLALLGALGFVVGYFVRLPARWAARRRPLPAISSDSVAIPYAIAVLCGAFLLVAVFFARAGGSQALKTMISGRSGAEAALYQGSSAYLYSALLLVIPASLLLVDVGLRRRDRVLIGGGILGLLPIVAQGAATGTRSSLLPVLASVWMLPYLRRGTRPRPKAVIAGAFLVLTLGITFVGATRDISVREHGFQQPFVASVLRPDEGVRRLLESGDTEMAPLLAITASKVPHTYPYMDGAATGEIFVHWIPRALWPAKPRQGDEVLARRLFYATGISNAPRQFSPLGNFYLDLGLVGGFLGMMFLGMLARAHYEYFRHHSRNASVQLLYAATLPFWIVLLRGNMTDTAGRLVFIVAPLLLGIYLGRGRRRLFEAQPLKDLAAAGREV
jgi:O-antigen/teichoic acid export membrane protein